MQRVQVQRDFNKPVDRVFSYLAHHENLGVLFGLRVERIREGDTDPNGAGSVRRLSLNGKLPFEETVTESVPNELIRYRITKGGPLRDHSGEMRFSSREGGGSRLDYTIEFDSAVPGLAAVVRLGLDRSIRRGLAKVDAAA